MPSSAMEGVQARLQSGVGSDTGLSAVCGVFLQGGRQVDNGTHLPAQGRGRGGDRTLGPECSEHIQKGRDPWGPPATSDLQTENQKHLGSSEVGAKFTARPHELTFLIVQCGHSIPLRSHEHFIMPLYT